jgi:alpha-tubulin suppressor-like RCC1 family protein
VLAFARWWLLGSLGVVLAGWVVPARAAAGGAAPVRPGSDPLLAWGSNIYGQLGDGAVGGPPSCSFGSCRKKPVRVEMPKRTRVTAVAAGNGFSLAVSAAGNVRAWGYNGNGELGDGTTTDSDLPVKVKLPIGTTVTAVAAGFDHSLALTSTGVVLAWGKNRYGQLGDGTMKRSLLPVRVSLPTGVQVVAIAAGSYYSLALTSTGSVLAWGNNAVGELGDGTSGPSSDVPVAVSLPPGAPVTAIAAGGGHSLAVTSTGSMVAWGYNAYGELGNATTVSSDVPVVVNLPTDTEVTAVAAGLYHSLALTSTGRVLAWGENNYGQLGDGTSKGPQTCYVGVACSTTPVDVELPEGTDVTAVAAGAWHSLALTSTGKLRAWGYNVDGELGNGTTTNTDLPVKVKLPKGDTATAVGAEDEAYESLTVAHHT